MANIAKIFVIIVTYKGHHWYERCFTSLRNSEYPVQTVVIDNASSDGTIEYIREHFPEVHLIESKENLGFGRANNIGMRYALDHGCDYVFLLNQDAWIEPNSIKELVRIHQEYPEYGLLSPMHINAEKTHLNILLDDGKNNYEMLSDLYFNSLQNVYTITYANAAAWLLPRTTIETIGGFCPLFFYCGEDDDYINRLKYHKILMGCVPSLLVVHDSKNRLTGVREKQEKANREALDVLLNINSNVEPISLLLYYFRKWVLNVLRFDVSARKKCSEKIMYLFCNFKCLNTVRKLHKTQASHWL
jgi:GT2 family glycosyltransferase